MKIIKLSSRGEDNYLEETKDGYILHAELDYMRHGQLPDGTEFIDPSGGPMLYSGMYLKEVGATIESIQYIDNHYLIKFKQ